MAKTQPKTVGGSRPGAGRKIAHSEGRTIPLVASVPKSLVERMMVIATAKDWNRSQAVTEAIRLLLKRHERRTGVSIPPAKADPSGRV